METMAAPTHQSTAAEHLFADYWAEYRDIEINKKADEEEYQSKTPDEGEQELAWLKEAGYEQLASTFEDGKELSDVDLETLMSTLTQSQAAVVKKRVDTISATLRKRHKHAKTDVREIFPQGETQSLPTSPDHVRRAESMYVIGRPNRKGSGKGRESSFMKRGGYDMTGIPDIVQDSTNTGIATLSIQPKSTISRTTSATISGPVNPVFTILDQESSCQFLEEENSQNGSVSPKDGLPNFCLAKDSLGITHVGDLSNSDLLRIRSLALIELTIVLETNGIFHTRRKPKVKSKDHGIFGVSLQTLLEFDRKRQPDAKIPLVFEQLIYHLDKTGLDSEGILRVPGSTGRVKQLRQDLEEKFYQPDFSWDDVWPNDAAAILKQLLRELPAPLLTHEYLEAFSQVESIPERKDQLTALNLLILVLPEAHRNTLLALLKFLQRVVAHINENRMSLVSVAMIMAPNLFLVNTKSKNVREIEVNMAAGTSNIVRMLVKYQPLLWTVPSFLIMQIRQQLEFEQTRKSRDKSRTQQVSRRRSLHHNWQIMKFLGKRDKSDIYRKPPIAHEADFQDGVIRVQAPNLTKSCAAIQLDTTTKAGDIVAKFRRQDDHSPTWTGDGSSGHPLTDHRKQRMFANPDNATYAEDNTYLYELGGNIGERCLDHNTSMLLLYRINPNAEWVIKARPPARV